MYRLLVSHPNDLVRWKTVDEYEDAASFKDRIEFPQFAWEPGLCLVCVDDENTDLFTGIFNQKECVYVGPDSDVMKKYKWDYDPDSLRYAHNKNLIRAWTECPNATWMIKVCASVIPRTTLVAALCACARVSMNNIPKNIHQPLIALGIAEQWTRGVATTEQVKEAGEKAVIPWNGTPTADDPKYSAERSAYFAIMRTVTGVINMTMASSVPSSVSASLWNGQGISPADTQHKLADLVREKIPFHEVALGMTRFA